MDRIEEIVIDGKSVLFNLDNGKTVTFNGQIRSIFDEQTQTLLNEFHFFDKPDFSPSGCLSPEIVNPTICIANECNMQCRYCFRKTSSVKSDVTLENCLKYISLLLENQPQTKLLRIDFTGIGEPLLKFDVIKKIIDYYEKFPPKNIKWQAGFTTNLLLLNKDIADYIKDKGLYLGISLDGMKPSHDINRKSLDGKGTFDRILSHMQLLDKDHIGVSASLTNNTRDLLGNFKFFLRYFSAITIKPVRSSTEEYGMITSSHIPYFTKQYKDIANYILSSCRKGNILPLKTIIRDEDTFGRFLRRVICGVPILSRCGAGTVKSSLGGDGKIYFCGAATGIDVFDIGSIEKGFDRDKQQKLVNVMLNREKCRNCWAIFICGGPCLVDEWQKNGSILELNNDSCLFTKEIIKVALWLKMRLLNECSKEYESIRGLCFDHYYQ